MENKYAGTQTEKNLEAAFAGESQARNKYTYYASKAKKDGFEQIAAIFEATASNEKEHAKMWFKELHGGSVPGTEENLKDAADGEITRLQHRPYPTVHRRKRARQTRHTHRPWQEGIR